MFYACRNLNVETDSKPKFDACSGSNTVSGFFHLTSIHIALPLRCSAYASPWHARHCRACCQRHNLLRSLRCDQQASKRLKPILALACLFAFSGYCALAAPTLPRACICFPRPLYSSSLTSISSQGSASTSKQSAGRCGRQFAWPSEPGGAESFTAHSEGRQRYRHLLT